MLDYLRALRYRRFDEGRAFVGELMLVADRQTPYRLVSEVRYSALQAGFDKVSFVTVRSPALGGGRRARCIATTSPHYQQPQRKIDISRLAEGKRPPESPARAPATQPAPTLVVAISEGGFIVASGGKLLRNSQGVLPTISRTDKSLHDGYSYPALAKLVVDIKRRSATRRRVVVSADRRIPLQTVIHTLDALRGTATERCLLSDGCLFDRVVLSAGIE